MSINIFVASIKRLYDNGLISEQRIIDLLNNSKITEEEKNYILNNNQ